MVCGSREDMEQMGLIDDVGTLVGLVGVWGDVRWAEDGAGRGRQAQVDRA